MRPLDRNPCSFLPHHLNPARFGDLVAHAMRRQQELGATLIYPFDDPAIVADHASLGAEIIEDLPDVDAVIVPVGGGGLISGAATALKRARPDIRSSGSSPTAPTWWTAVGGPGSWPPLAP